MTPTLRVLPLGWGVRGTPRPHRENHVPGGAFFGPPWSALQLRLVAGKEWRGRRVARLEGWPLQQAVARCTEVDRTRERFTRYFFGADALVPAQFDCVVNTGRVPLPDVVAYIAALVQGEA